VLTKAEVRRLMREALAHLSPGERRRKSEGVAGAVLSLPEVTGAHVVMVFLSLPDEVDTRPLIGGLWQQGKVVAVPHTDVAGGRLLPVRLDCGGALESGALSVPEPRVQEPVPLAEVEVVILPGRAFDRDGHRLGRGKGFYDRFLQQKRCVAFRVAVAFSEQVLAALPHGPNDARVHVLVTEDEVLRFP
jgi:5-formyltetrahydrofolate cyclo-ligase